MRIQLTIHKKIELFYLLLLLYSSTMPTKNISSLSSDSKQHILQFIDHNFDRDHAEIIISYAYNNKKIDRKTHILSLYTLYKTALDKIIMTMIKNKKIPKKLSFIIYNKIAQSWYITHTAQIKNLFKATRVSLKDITDLLPTIQMLDIYTLYQLKQTNKLLPIKMHTLNRKKDPEISLKQKLKTSCSQHIINKYAKNSNNILTKYIYKELCQRYKFYNPQINKNKCGFL